MKSPFIHSIIHQIMIEGLQCARKCASFWEYILEPNTAPTFQELKVKWGRQNNSLLWQSMVTAMKEASSELRCEGRPGEGWRSLQAKGQEHVRMWRQPGMSGVTAGRSELLEAGGWGRAWSGCERSHGEGRRGHITQGLGSEVRILRTRKYTEVFIKKKGFFKHGRVLNRKLARGDLN